MPKPLPAVSPAQRLSRTAAARILGVKPETVTYYRRIGRLPSVRNASGHNEHYLRDVNRLALRRAARLRQRLRKIHCAVA
jgi:DNA-binding transcriptional MerR regulator